MYSSAIAPAVPEARSRFTSDSDAWSDLQSMAHSHEKHPLLIRITHWINFPVLLVMIWSGILIYWANDIYWPRIPSDVYEFFGVKQRLAEGMGFHFAFMWIFTINGLIYVTYLLSSGAWRELFPNRHSLGDAWRVILHDLHLRKTLPTQGKYNGAQRILYTLALIMGAGAVLTGFAIYKPVQLNFLKNALGGYETSRLLHYVIAVGFVLFIILHVIQVARAGARHFATFVTGVEGASRRRMAGAFSVLATFLALVTAGLWVLKNSELDHEVQKPLRLVLDWNASIGLGLLNTERVDQLPSRPPVRGRKARENGDAGLSQPIDVNTWRLNVVTEGPARTEAGVGHGTFAIDQIKAMPHTEVTVQFKCIEGWSELMSFGGVRFIDFLRANKFGTKSGEPIDIENRPDDVFKYVGMKTPDGEYFVAIDMKSALNPQTLLAYEQNGVPLTEGHGAPLRLYIPNKYGVKSLKRIGTITFTDQRPRDYWHDDGYDWFIGL